MLSQPKSHFDGLMAQVFPDLGKFAERETHLSHDGAEQPTSGYLPD
jgi:hypothetical protein